MYNDLDDPAARIAAAIKRRHGQSERVLVPVIESIDIESVRSNLRPPPAEQEDAPLDGYGLYKALISRLPHETQASFSTEQIRALRQACEQLRWGKHSLDCRVSFPWFGRRFYTVLLGGVERRSSDRLLEDGNNRSISRIIISLASLVLILWLGIFAVKGGLTF